MNEAAFALYKKIIELEREVENLKKQVLETKAELSRFIDDGK